MKLHAQMYLVAGIGMIVALLNGQLVEGGAHLLITWPWDIVIKLSALLAIGAYFVETVDILRSKDQ